MIEFLPNIALRFLPLSTIAGDLIEPVVHRGLCLQFLNWTDSMKEDGTVRRSPLAMARLGESAVTS